MHNDFGFGHANTLAGIKAGATHAGVTVLGLGERAGNVALEEVVMVLKFLEGIDLKCKTTLFREISEYVARHLEGTAFLESHCGYKYVCP